MHPSASDSPVPESASAEKLQPLLERYLAAAEPEQRAAMRAFVAEVKRTLTKGEPETAAYWLRRAVVPGMDYTSAQELARMYQELRPLLEGAVPLRVAVLSSFTSRQLAGLIELFLFGAGFRTELWEADYGVMRQEVLDPASPLYAFRPETVFLATSRRDLADVPELTADPAGVKACVEMELSSWCQLWHTLHERLGCQVIQNNFDTPPWRPLGNHEMRHPASFARYVQLVNMALTEQAAPFVVVHDLDALAACHGRWRWGDERFHHHAKMPCAPEFLVDYAHSVASLLLAQKGVCRKCLVLDLDNTLWGGVIGDDGLAGIRLGQGDAEGEAYLAFQRYVKTLQLRGVLLAVCSKNDESTAREVFTKHPEMLLRLDDISCFVANWHDKAANLRAIAEALNIGLGALVFVDDNPAERSVVRQLVPEVAVPEMPADCADYIRTLEGYRYFQVTTLATEDFKRTEFYQANKARVRAQATASNIDAFLQSLRMSARIEPISATSLERSAQLISRSNQFNLTTRRYTKAELLSMMEDGRWITRTVSLADRFGDNGLISVVLAHESPRALQIDTWLMSCRVLKRGVEGFVLNHLVKIARERQLSAILGEYVPTAKNALVRDHFRKLGFALVREAEDGHSWWELSVRPDWQAPSTFIEEVPPPGPPVSVLGGT